MSLWSRIKGALGLGATRPSAPARPEPLPKGPEVESPVSGTPNEVLQRRFLSESEYDDIRHRKDVVWEVWKERRMGVLERNIVNQGKALKGHHRADFEDIVRWGRELEELRPGINWRKDLATP